MGPTQKRGIKIYEKEKCAKTNERKEKKNVSIKIREDNQRVGFLTVELLRSFFFECLQEIRVLQQAQ